MSTDLRAVSVWNPWAWALVAGLKTHENRPWKLPHQFIGKRVLIHCGKKKPDEGSIEDVTAEANAAGFHVPEWAARPVGGIVGSVVFDLDETPTESASIWATGERCWRVQPGTAVMLAAAIPCKGFLGFFRVGDEISSRFLTVATTP